MCCGCCCFNANCCCDPFKYAHISAFLCLGEAVFMFCVNVCLIFVHTCVFAPPESFGIFEESWSWFFYDEDNCLATQGSNYTAPLWITENPIPDYFQVNTTMGGTVSPGANFSYQITFLICHTVWGLSSFVLIYGNARKLWEYYLPWMFTTCLIIILDIIFASFYIALWDQSEPGWEDSQSFFYMITLYLRGYIFVIFNIIQFLNVFHAFKLTCTKRSKQKQRDKDLRKELTTQSHHQMQQLQLQQPQQQQQLNPNEPTPVRLDVHYHHHEEENNLVPKSETEQFHYQDMVPAPTRFRPFSYLSSYRPSSPSDIENMKQKGQVNGAFENQEKKIYPNIQTDASPSAPPDAKYY